MNVHDRIFWLELLPPEPPVKPIYATLLPMVAGILIGNVCVNVLFTTISVRVKIRLAPSYVIVALIESPLLSTTPDEVMSIGGNGGGRAVYIESGGVCALAGVVIEVELDGDTLGDTAGCSRGRVRSVSQASPVAANGSGGNVLDGKGESIGQGIRELKSEAMW